MPAHDSNGPGARALEFFAALPDAVVLVSSAGEIAQWLGAAPRLFGYTADEAVGQRFHDLLERESSGRLGAEIARDGSFIGIVQLRRKGMAEIRLDAHARALSGGDWIATFRETRAVEPLQAVLEQLPVGVMMAEAPSGRVVFTNDQASAIFHGPITQTQTRAALERSFEAWDASGRRLKAEEFPLGRAIAGEVVHGQEVQFRRADGSIGWVRANAGPVRAADGRVLAAITAYFDITAEKQLESRLRQESRVNETLHRLAASFATEREEQKLVQLITDEATALTGASFGAFFFNVSDERGQSYMLYTLAGAPRSAFENFPMPRNTDVFHPTFAGLHTMRLGDVLKDPRYGKNPPHYGMPKGHLPVRSYLAVPVKGRDGKVMGGLFFGHAEPDRFTEHHERIVVGIAYQAAIALENARLLESLRRSEEQARLADRRKDEFLAMLGHELRNPLAPIVTALQLIELRHGDVAGRERSVIARQVGHLTRLVDDLLDVSRITRGKIELKRAPVEVSECVAKAVEITSPLLEQRQHEVVTDVPARGLILDADPVRLSQVLANLLNNAAKYTEPGGRIEVSARRDGEMVEVRVRDNGAGIEAELLPEIFNLFVQGQRALDRSQGGLGLGLTIVENLVRLHGGTVTARSAGPGKGSEFIVRLPLHPPTSTSAVPVEASPPRQRSDGARRKILVVDDNVDAAEILAEGLRAAGHEVRTVSDGSAALSVAAQFLPQVALVDIGLPLIDGYELALQLRRDPALRGLRLVAVTGDGQTSDRQRSQQAGFDAHLVKPLHLEQVIDAIDVR